MAQWICNDFPCVGVQDYLRQLEAIRYQNFVERRAVHQNKVNKNSSNNNDNIKNNRPESQVDSNMGDPRFDPEARRKKIQALKVMCYFLNMIHQMVLVIRGEPCNIIFMTTFSTSAYVSSFGLIPSSKSDLL